MQDGRRLPAAADHKPRLNNTKHIALWAEDAGEHFQAAQCYPFNKEQDLREESSAFQKTDKDLKSLNWDRGDNDEDRGKKRRRANCWVFMSDSVVPPEHKVRALGELSKQVLIVPFLEETQGNPTCPSERDSDAVWFQRPCALDFSISQWHHNSCFLIGPVLPRQNRSEFTK